MLYSVQPRLSYFNSIHWDFSFMHVRGIAARLASKHRVDSVILILWLLWKSLVPFFSVSVDVWEGCNQPLVRIRLTELKTRSGSFFLKSIKYILLNGGKLRLAQTELRDACLDAKWPSFTYRAAWRRGTYFPSLHDHIFMGEDYTLCFSRSHIHGDVRNNFPWTPAALCSSLAHCPGISQ